MTDVLPDAQTEAETMKVVLTLAEEMGLKASSLEKAISSASAHSVLEKIEEVSCTFWILVLVEPEAWL